MGEAEAGCLQHAVMSAKYAKPHRELSSRNHFDLGNRVTAKQLFLMFREAQTNPEPFILITLIVRVMQLDER